MNQNVRRAALAVLEDHRKRSNASIHNAIVDLRRNAKLGDEKILEPFLDHSDPMVVAATLYTLFEVHDQKKKLRPLLERLASEIDVREEDELDHPIQCMSIALIGSLGVSDSAAMKFIVAVAEDRSVPAVPRKRAWQVLAENCGVDWPSSASEEMIFNPESQESEQLRDKIRKAIGSTS